LGVIFRFIRAARNEIRSQPIRGQQKWCDAGPRNAGTRRCPVIKAHLCHRHLSHPFKICQRSKTLRDRTLLAEVKFLLVIYCSRIFGVCGIAKFAAASILDDCTVWCNYKPFMDIAKSMRKVLAGSLGTKAQNGRSGRAGHQFILQYIAIKK
jgi:hypothetical protein